MIIKKCDRFVFKGSDVDPNSRNTYLIIIYEPELRLVPTVFGQWQLNILVDMFNATVTKIVM